MNYLVFLGLENQPKGGMNDLLSIKDSLEDSYKILEEKLKEYENSKINIWGHIYDLKKQKIIYHFNDKFIDLTT